MKIKNPEKFNQALVAMLVLAKTNQLSAEMEMDIVHNSHITAENYKNNVFIFLNLIDMIELVPTKSMTRNIGDLLAWCLKDNNMPPAIRKEILRWIDP